MVTLEEMKQKKKIKVLLKGYTASGKTFTCIKVAEIGLRAGKNVLYLDHERGSVDEIINYFEDHKTKNIENLYHEDYRDYNDLMSKIKKYVIEKKDSKGNALKGNGIDLVIIDPIPLLQICRISATETIKKQGFYYMGEKMVKLVDIEDPSQFTKQIANGDVDNRIAYSLRGWQYQLSNDWEWGFKDFLVSMPPDIVCTLMTDEDKKEKNTLDGCFDYVIEMFKKEDTIQTTKKTGTEIAISKEYKAIPRKLRGEKQRITPEWTDPWRRVIRPFCNKYLGKECEESGITVPVLETKDIKEDVVKDKKDVKEGMTKEGTKNGTDVAR